MSIAPVPLVTSGDGPGGRVGEGTGVGLTWAQAAAVVNNALPAPNMLHAPVIRQIRLMASTS
jgi:hypothetical protein